MEKFRHIAIHRDEFGRVLNQCTFKRNDKNGNIIYIGCIACAQCRYNKGKDDDGNTVCSYGCSERQERKPRRRKDDGGKEAENSGN